MKTKLFLLTFFILGLVFQLKTTAQDLNIITKSRPADFEYLSTPDSLGIRHSLKMPNFQNKNSLVIEPKLPYPIIFIHGLNSGSNTWNTFTDFMDTNYFLTYGGRFDINLNLDNNLSTANKEVYPTQGADIGLYQGTWLQGGDYYYVNFAIDSDGSYNVSCSNLSNQSAIAKQGKALQNIITYVMQLTGRDKVVLMGHSMGGLAAREYLENQSNWQIDGQHHVAKLVTTGTPHGGSNASISFLGTIFAGIDNQSEAIRDLRTSYFYSPYAPGVFLFGGIESNYVMNDMLLNNFYNVDVNCNGIIGEDLNGTGLNQKNLYTNLDYSCIIGTGLSSGDGVVSTTSANLNNYYSNITENIFTSSVIHTSLPSQIYKNIQGLDESGYFNIAYGIRESRTYTGFITEQSPNSSYITDYDDYTFNISSNSQVNVSITNGLPFSIYVSIYDVNYNLVGQTITLGNGINNISQFLTTGKYYLEIFGTPTPTSYQTPYTFNINYTLSNQNFSTKSLILYPNPTNSKVFFDNSKMNYEKVSICNTLGQEVTKLSFNTINQNQEVDLSGLSNGVYLLKFSNQEMNKTVKVVKE